MTDDPREDQCASTRTVQLGTYAAVDLRCMMERWQHAEPLHFSSRSFGDVNMQARWPGAFEEPD